MTTRPALSHDRDEDYRVTYAPTKPHPVPIPADDVVEAVTILHHAFDSYSDMDISSLDCLGGTFAPVAASLHTLFRYRDGWDMEVAHIPFHDVEQLVRTLLDLSDWQYEGCEVPPGAYQDIAAEIALAHRLTLALDAYGLATYALTEKEAAAEPAEAATPTPTTAEEERTERASAPDDEAAASSTDELIAAYGRLSRTLAERGVDVQEALQTATERPASAMPAT